MIIIMYLNILIISYFILLVPTCITGTTAEPSLIKRCWDKNLKSIQISHWKEGIDLHQVDSFFIDQGLVVQKVDNAIQWI